MKRALTFILALMMALSLCACGNKGGGSKDKGGEKTGDITQVPCEIAIHDYYVTNYKGGALLVLYLDVTNKSGQSIRPYDICHPTAYQNGIEVSDYLTEPSTYKTNDFPDNLSGAIKQTDKIKDGATATVYYLLPLDNQTDNVDIEVYGGEELVADDGSTYIRPSDTLIFSNTITLG